MYKYKNDIGLLSLHFFIPEISIDPVLTVCLIFSIINRFTEEVQRKSNGYE